MPAPTSLVFTDTFARPATRGPNLYGVQGSSFAVGNDWRDRVGGTWNLTASGNCNTVNAGNGYSTGLHLYQDGSLTPGPNQRIVGTIVPFTETAGNQGAAVLVHAQQNGDCYFAQIKSNGATQLFAVVGGNPTQIGTTVTATIVATHALILDLTVTGDAATTTSFTFTVTDASTATVIATVTGTNTSAAFLLYGGVVGISSNTANSTFNIGFSKVQIYSDVAYTTPLTYLGFIGDSTTSGVKTTIQSASEAVGRILSARQSSRRYVSLNAGQPSSATADWLSASATTYLTNAVAYFNAIGATTIAISLGLNDARSSIVTATHIANMQAIINYVNANVTGAKIIVNSPLPIDVTRFGGGYPANSNSLLSGYVAQYGTLTGATIGDQTAVTSFFPQTLTATADGVHPGDAGVPIVASLWANAIVPTSIAPGARFIRRF